MNIHFTDEKIFFKLMSSSLFKIRFGSHIYGLNNEKSDSDIMVIYAEPSINSQSFFKTHHQFQYKKDGVDYVFLTLQQFISNCLSGDSTINFEVLHTEELNNNNMLSFLYENREMFYNYNICKSYLGFAKRDYNALKKKGQYTGKKASHFVRGVMTAHHIIDNKDVSKVYEGEEIRMLKFLKNKTTILDEEVKEILEMYEKLMSLLRERINEILSLRDIEKSISSVNAYKLNKFIYDLVNTEEYKSKQLEWIDFNNLIEKGEYDEEYNYVK